MDRLQPDINFKMRRILIDWLVEIAEEFNLFTETLQLAVNYMDRFCSKCPVPRSQYQLLGTTCMWIAGERQPDVLEFACCVAILNICSI